MKDGIKQIVTMKERISMPLTSGSTMAAKSSAILKIFTLKELLFELTKFRITFAVTITTFVGYLLYNGTVDLNLILPTIGVLILAAGASALNEYQERNVDSQMIRTKGRPIPSGRISPNSALAVSVTLLFFGSILLLIHSYQLLLLGLFTVIWYNVIYTPLKQITEWAIIPGSLVGALPPIIGWVAAGGFLFSSKILAFGGFMFIWQIPHFWLLLLMYDEQYRKAGFPTLSLKYSIKNIKKITFLWISILAVSSLIFIFTNLVTSYVGIALLILSSIYSNINALKLFRTEDKNVYRNLFIQINTYVLFLLIIISLESIL